MKRVLVAIDGSDCAFRAVEYCGAQFSGADDVSITLFHVLPYLPARIWDIGHILSAQEKAAQERMVEAWLEDRKAKAGPIFERAAAVLEKAGVTPDRIAAKVVSDSTDVAGSILEEARDGGYLTLVLGRCGPVSLGEFFMGSTTSRIMNRGAGVAVCVVE